jgi:SAM-dependent methyltransferase
MTSELSPPAEPDRSADPGAVRRPRPYLDLFLISFIILFFELACIRWFGSTVVYLTFFTNIVLMACVLGMSVGCLAASRDRNYADGVIPLALAAVALAYGTLEASRHDRIEVYIGNQDSPQQVYFGADSAPIFRLGKTLPIEAVAGFFYALIALLFLGLGQVMGRSFRAIPDHIAAYSTNLAGSLAGIAAFAAASYFRTTPVVWFAVALVLSLRFVSRRVGLQALGVLATLAVVGAASSQGGEGPKRVLWSPYYKVAYDPKSRTIETNNIGHQRMVSVEAAGLAYVLPHLLRRDAGERPFRDVMIIGAGSGNDVQAALSHGVRHVDAVEIDPLFYELGRDNHPDRPYADPRVSVHLDDGRSFLRKTGRTYDAVIYALVDSLVLHSGYSSIRLESFLFTEQAFRDVRARLKPDGVFLMYNYFRQGWVVGRLVELAERVFGTKPIVISLPYRAKIAPGQAQAGSITLLVVGNSEAALAPVREKLSGGNAFWAHISPRNNEPVNGYGPRPPALEGTTAGEWRKIAPAAVETAGVGRLPSDDWPFLYLREPVIPSLNLRGILIVVTVSLVILRQFAPVRTVRPNWQMFFLGAGFMLLETKGVVHLALLFGSTWVVSSIVFFAILVMTLLSNLFVKAVHPRSVRLAYGLLIASLLVNALVPIDMFLALPGALRVVVSCAVIFVPVFFAGVVFATKFRDSVQPDVDVGSNIGGVILGGLSENLSLVGGFNSLLLVAVGYYLLSALLAPRLRPSLAA